MEAFGAKYYWSMEKSCPTYVQQNCHDERLLQNADGVGLRHEDDATSIALPSGHAASTSASPYFTFFTNVISCHGSMADREKYKKEIAISAVKVVDDEDVSKRYEIVTYQTHQRAICTDM